MHKLVLGSGAIFFENEEDPILNHIISLADKTENWVFLPTADRDSHDMEETVRSYALRHGFTKMTSLYLIDSDYSEEYIRDTILSADVIYADGGNLKILLDTWRKTKADKYLKMAYDNGTVIAGQSSGAMCWCRHGYDNCGKDGRFMFMDGLDLIPFILCPHFEDWQHFLTNAGMQELDALAVDNDIALAICDNEYTVIDSHRNPRHSAFYLPYNEDFKVYDLQKEHIPVNFKYR